GSGKKFKRCCLNAAPPASTTPHVPSEEAIKSLHHQMLADMQRRQRFGEVKPLIHADWCGEKWIAVGSELHHSSAWKTPVDFLCDYPKHCFTPAWGKQELAKSLAERHPVMQWY